MKEASMLNYQDIKELSWKRPLTAAEQAALQQYLAAHPEAHKEWAGEAALNRLVQRLPAVPVSSNFTARVMQQIQRTPPRRSWWESLNLTRWLEQGWLPRVAVTCMVFSLSAFSVYHRQTQTERRGTMAYTVAQVSRVAGTARMDWLKDYDTIKRLSKIPAAAVAADDELLAVLR